jgi:HEAT repeat protein
VAGGAVADLRVHVGPPRADTAGVRDWGAVPAADAAALALSLAQRLTGRAAQRAVAAAAVADSADVWRGLLALARAGGAELRTRQSALHWLGAVAPAEAVAPVTALARGAGEPRAVREGALSVLAFVGEGAGVPTLVGLARGGEGGDGWLREKAIFWLGQADDDRARAALRALASGDTVARDAREQAIFALGHGAGDAEAGAFLRALYPRLPDGELRDKAIQSVAQSDDAESGRWLLGIAASEREPLEARKQALFWAGQRDEEPVARLIAVYPRLAGTELRKHYAFVLSQRDEEAAVDALIAVARRDDDPAVRRQAIFWLGQSRSPRAQRDLVEVLER